LLEGIFHEVEDNLGPVKVVADDGKRGHGGGDFGVLPSLASSLEIMSISSTMRLMRMTWRSMVSSILRAMGWLSKPSSSLRCSR